MFVLRGSSAVSSPRHAAHMDDAIAAGASGATATRRQNLALRMLAPSRCLVRAPRWVARGQSAATSYRRMQRTLHALLKVNVDSLATEPTPSFGHAIPHGPFSSEQPRRHGSSKMSEP
eukprot:6182851-Pleurochrysis_carterae.AAC.2